MIIFARIVSFSDSVQILFCVVLLAKRTFPPVGVSARIVGSLPDVQKHVIVLIGAYDKIGGIVVATVPIEVMHLYAFRQGFSESFGSQGNMFGYVSILICSGM